MATFEFRLPDIGEGVVEGEIVKWLVKEGDRVDEDQGLVEVMTDKATVTIPSPRKGRVSMLHGKEGEFAKVHAPLVTLEVDGSTNGQAAPAKAASSDGPSAQKPVPGQKVASTEKVLATPVTRRIAREHGVDLASIEGSGPSGRVTKADVISAIGAERPPPNPVRRPEPIASSAVDQRVPLKGLRRKIAENMVRSKFTAPHFTFVEEMDATELVQARERINQALTKAQDTRRISFLPFIAKGLVAALRKYPTLNANFDEEHQELIVRREYNFGIATATPDGLTVPVVKGVDRLSLQRLADEVARLSAGARDKKLSVDELSGGTFTITSLGQQGGLFATPIIHHPEVAILGVHKMRKRPVVRDDQVVIRQMMYLSLSFDHRVIDGQVGAEFTYELIRHLETPELLFLEL